jgi:hypothetical protein
MERATDLLDRFLDDEISGGEHDQFLAWLTRSDHNVILLAERAELHADLRRTLRRRDIQQSAMTTIGAGKLHPRFRTAVVAMATLALSISLAFLFFRDKGTDELPPTVASIAYQSHAVWVDGKRVTGHAIGAGLHKLDVGIARLDFANGVSVTLQGPAVFEVLTANGARLHSGILTAYVPESAVGFAIHTPTLEVVDLGTAFGVSVGSDGETDVCVFAGKVQVSAIDTTVRRAPQTVAEGNAIRTLSLSGNIETVTFDTERFADTWPITSGVLQTTGLMKFVPPGPEFVPGRHEDSDHILVFPERDNVLLDVAVPVDLVEAGQYQRINRKEGHVISAGQRVRSYLLQLDPVGRLKQKDPNKSRVMGQITFDRPIIGLIASSVKLRASDQSLGHPHGDYGTAPRGIEPHRQSDLPASGRDVVVLSKDQQTLSLDLSAGSAVDQIRVLVSRD